MQIWFYSRNASEQGGRSGSQRRMNTSQPSELRPSMKTVKEARCQIMAGGSAGLVLCTLHPLDLVKTRLQLGKAHYSGLGDVFYKTFKREGLQGFYKGILPPIMIETPRRATKFFSFEQYKQMFTSHRLPTELTLSFAGLFSGLTEAVLINPFEVVKVRLQSDMAAWNEKQKSTFGMARSILRRHGIFNQKGFYCGFGATACRDSMWNFVYFGLYHKFKHLVPDDPKQPLHNLLGHFGLGFVASVLASTINFPFDVAKSRIQSQMPDDPVQRYHSTWQTIQLVRSEEGTTALFRGLSPRSFFLNPKPLQSF